MQTNLYFLITTYFLEFSYEQIHYTQRSLTLRSRFEDDTLISPARSVQVDALIHVSLSQCQGQLSLLLERVSSLV